MGSMVRARSEPGVSLPAPPKPTLRARDALDRLRCDHEHIRKLLRDHERLRQAGAGAAESKATIVERLCDALSLCALIEEELFYPMVRRLLGDNGFGLATLCDHARLRNLIARLDEMEPDHPGYDEAVVAIGDCVLPGMQLARTVLFVELRMTGLDTAALGQQMRQRRRAHEQLAPTRIDLPPSGTALASWPPTCRLASV